MNAQRCFLLVVCASVAGCSDASSPGPAAHLVFDVQPTAVGPGSPLATTVAVGVRDVDGSLITDWIDEVSLRLEGGAGAGSLQGTTSVTPVVGLATFEELTPSTAGSGYRLVASSGSLEEARSELFDVPAVFRAVKVVAGNQHSCTLDADGRAWCWGSNASGQLGDGTNVNRIRPTAVATDLRFTALAAGGNRTCGLTAEGVLHCWGATQLNALGAGQNGDVPAPQAVALPSPVMQVGVGYMHVCALLQDGRAYCWGDNVQGMLGTGSTETVVTAPEAVAGNLSFTSISVGYEAMCGLTAEGAAYCWGWNLYGELGNGSRMEPRSTPSLVLGGHVFRELVAGGGPCHGETCGIDDQGRTWCWGKNYQRSFDLPDGWVTVPTAVEGDPGFETILPAPLMVCGITSSDALYCWGDPADGQLGNGSTTSVSTPTRVLPDHGVASVTLGWDHICAVTTDGETWCWGDNGYGQLGNGSNPFGWMRPVPVWQPGSQ